jgi:hypothetical protein
MRISASELPVTLEIESLLDYAVEIAEKEEYIVSQIKALTLLVKSARDENKIAISKKKLQFMIDSIAPYCMEEVPLYLKKAQQVV